MIKSITCFSRIYYPTFLHRNASKEENAIVYVLKENNDS